MQPLAPERSRIGWIGLGRIGAPMAQRVRDAGWPLTLWARHPERAPTGLTSADVSWAESLAELASRSQAIVTVVSGPTDVQELHQALMPIAARGTVFIDLSTALPATGEQSSAWAERYGQGLLDCPVTGGVAGAQRGSLTGFAGGSAQTLAQATPLLQAFCQRVVACGPSGSGYRIKLINQTLMAGALMGLADGARLARSCGMDTGWLKSTLASGTGSSALLESYLDRMMSGAGPVTFTLGLLLKDLQLARSAAADLGVSAPLLDAAIATVGGAVDRHGAQAGLQALAL